ncbi:RmlD-like substrate binding domain-containing protein [Radiomyces spectabilis]|uniref:RmlD-like substrate binding domain-containing protein n=1 Tax=Radiomyces spectabilis TaxID=64574 RepID=UPI0022204B1F|nr:RmlD-like substrate binding domain-containing protein [Radiomyces spectabilis]KAI8379624.1 RmlD-like substrate binding domain-containing protein [Radiomyces spectabilis]
MKVVITGASGLLGRAVSRQFKSAGHDVVGTALNRTQNGLVKLNLLDGNAVEEFLKQEKPNVLVHCAAERRPDVAEKDQDGTMHLNVQVPKHLASFCKTNNIILIYISTDYVFDGTAPPYEVDAKPNPLQFYGRTKLGGEQAIQEVDSQAIILRVPILYGATEFWGESAVNVLIEATQDKSKPVVMDNYCIRYPTNVEDIARVIQDLSLKRLNGDKSVAGIFHFSGEEKFTKYTMAKLFAQILNVSQDHLEPQNEVSQSASATRPHDSHLSNKRLQEFGINTDCIGFEKWWRSYLSKN